MALYAFTCKRCNLTSYTQSASTHYCTQCLHDLQQLDTDCDMSVVNTQEFVSDTQEYVDHIWDAIHRMCKG